MTGDGSSESDKSLAGGEDKSAFGAGRRGVSFGWLLVVLFAGLAIRWVYLRQIEDVPFFHHLVGDAARYWEWAGQIARGDLLGRETFYQAPLYPYCLAGMRGCVGDDLFTIRLIQALLGSAACVVLAAATCRFLDSRVAGMVAGFLLAFSPQAIFYGALIQKSVLDLILSCVLIWMIACAQRWDDPRKPVSNPGRFVGFVVTGMVIGLLTLSRENALLLLAPLAGWVAIYFHSHPIRRRFTWFGGMVIGLALVLVPVGLRNWHVGGTFALTTVQSGPNFYIGNHEGATGRYVALVPGHESPPFERDDARRLAEQGSGRELNDHEVSRYWLERSFDFIGSQPSAWLRLLWTKWLLVWNRYEIPDTEAWVIYAESSALLRWLGGVLHFGVVVPLAAGGVALAWLNRRRLACLYGMIVTLALATTAFYVLGRYRFPLLPLILVPAAAALERVVGMLRGVMGNKSADTKARREMLEPILAASAVLAAALFCNRTVNPEKQLDAMAYGNVGTVLAQQGALDQAAAMFRRAAEGNPHAAEPHYNLGLALAVLGRHEEAVAAFTRARSIAPELVNLDYNLAVSLERIGRTHEAIAAYERACQTDPHDREARAALERLSVQESR